MFCPSCGNELTSELVYCNRCGANLRPLTNQSNPGSKLVGAAWAISIAVVLVTLGGFGLIFALVMTMLSRGINLSGGGMALVVFFLLVVLAIALMLIRQLSRVLDVSDLFGGSSSAGQTPSALEQKSVQQISAPREPASSVTDHTTRMFEPAHSDRDTKR